MLKGSFIFFYLYIILKKVFHRQKEGEEEESREYNEAV